MLHRLAGAFVFVLLAGSVASSETIYWITIVEDGDEMGKIAEISVRQPKFAD